ncbi:pyroglutamyl-peptidase I, partial [Serratia marcescens]|uniref:pyroglutamyl-peptidase I family protein n=1 Tax=Serratia marcescens TaxID=615 RepID=UPI002813F60A|nr:pyroglutamyl-peptidase I [Serratia marcescens]
RADLSLERVAINLNDARIPDNQGLQPIDTPVVVQGPAAYFSTLPIKAMVRAIKAAGIDASVSHTAGTF